VQCQCQFQCISIGYKKKYNLTDISAVPFVKFSCRNAFLVCGSRSVRVRNNANLNSLCWDILHFGYMQRRPSNRFFSNDIYRLHAIVVPRSSIGPRRQERLDAPQVESLARYVQRRAARLQLWQLGTENCVILASHSGILL
jgi:hypothetical protein